MTGYEILGKQGIEALHHRKIAEALEINHAGVHYYYKTREDLLLALCEYAKARFESDLEKVQANRIGATKKLEAHIALFEAYARNQSRFFRAILSLYATGVGQDKLSDAAKNLLEYQHSRLEQDLEAAVQEGGIAQHSFLAESRSLFDHLVGLCVRSQITQAQDPTPYVDRLLAHLLKM